jgi:hypothetical protein
MILLAMAGQMGSGKDTVAAHLVANYGFTRLAFADNLKEMCKSVWNLTHEQVYGEKEKFQPFEQKLTLTKKHAKAVIKWVTEVNHISLTEYQENAILKLVGQEFETPRHILQYVGTEICRECIQDDFHANTVWTKIQREGLERIVVADCRFANEREKVIAWGGKTAIVTGRTTTQNASSAAKTHASETSLGDVSEYDFHLDNAGTLEELYRKTDEIMAELLSV